MMVINASNFSAQLNNVSLGFDLVLTDSSARNITKSNFNWTVLSIKNEKLKIGVVFNDATSMSPAEQQDYFIITFRNQSLFYTRDLRKTLYSTSTKVFVPR